MPTESPSTPIVTARGGASSGGAALPPPAALKCSACGAASLGPADGVVILGEEIERICASCILENQDGDGVRLSALRPRLGNEVVDRIRGRQGTLSSPVDPVVLDLARLRDAAAANRHSRRGATSPANSVRSSTSSAETFAPETPSTPGPEQPVAIAIKIPTSDREHEQEPQSKSLPAAKTSPWAPVPRVAPLTPTPTPPKPKECAPNPLLDVTEARVPSSARGCLYPGSTFTGSQRSGRNAYDVTVKVLDVSFASSTLCGYLTIKDLTETHPELTTFFDGEIIGPKYGFITGARYGATEFDDMRHWERFEQFRRPCTRADIVRGEMLLRDPITDPAVGRPRERDHIFIRIKEKFLVPDHSVRDINGASFAGFYYAMIDCEPTLEMEEAMPSSPLSPRSPLIGTRRLSSSAPRPDTPRRQSSSGPRPEAPRRGSTTTARPDAPRRQSTSRAPPIKAATLRGYYFHSLNQEPFQELSLVHQPSSEGGTFELR